MAKPKPLFNPRTIKKFCVNVEVTNTQKKAAKEWITLLENNKLEEEKPNYPIFMKTILEEILGYPIKEIEFERDNVEFQFSNSSGKKVVCFEAKGTSTKDLFSSQHRDKKEHETPIKQTWDYIGKNDLDYGVCTNYKDFILIDRNKGYSKCHLFDFNSIKNNEEKLKEFIAVFSKKSIIDNKFVEDLYHKSIIEEREFTKEFYKLFHETRLMLIKEFQTNNKTTKEEAIHYAQLYLNRLIFMFFGEDNDNIPKRLFPDRVLDILKSTLITEYSKLVSDTVLVLFESLNKGSPILNVFGFNGGLFKDPIPPHIYFTDMKNHEFFKDVYQHSELKKEIKLDEDSDKIIKRYGDKLNPILSNLLLMDSFDFNTELNVNILGHIFEQSLTDLENLREGEISKRKKEGIFYTPEYVTDYICRNTIIPYLSNNGAITIDDLIKEYSSNIEELEKKFKEIKILDPACGSGAFLLKAVDILLEIHKEIQAFKESGGQYTFFSKKRKSGLVEQFTLTKWHEEDEARKIIEKNIHGVDINEESVEITKLSLFLKIATSNRKLLDLSQNIKVGNSLINDKSVDSRSFDWKNEFKDIFDNGGFDIVVGNPPYVRVQELKYEDIDFFKSHYDVAHRRIDISMMFFELATKLVKKRGKIGFISSSQFMTAEYGRNLRKLLLGKRIEKFIDFGSLPVFEDAITYPTIIIFSINSPHAFNYYKITELVDSIINNLNVTLGNESKFIVKTNVEPSNLNDEVWNFSTSEISYIITKMKNGKNQVTLGSFANPSTGITTGLDKILLLDEDSIMKNCLENKILIRVLRGRNIDPWFIKGPFDHAVYPYYLESEKTELIPYEELKKEYPNINSYLLKYKNELLDRKDSRKTVAENKEWYGLIRKGKLEIFNSKKIVTPALTKHNSFAIDEDGSAFLTGGAGVFAFLQKEFDNYYLLAILNSKLVEYFLHSISTKKQGGYYSYLNTFLAQIPIIKLDKNQQKPFSEKAVIISAKTNELHSKLDKFIYRVLERFPNVVISKKLEKFYELNFQSFIFEIKKQTNSTFSLKETDEWDDYFNSYKNDTIKLSREIDDMKEELDLMVYKLYDLTENEGKTITLSLSKE